MSRFDPEQWDEIRSLFARALALPPEARAAFLDRECRGQALRQEVWSLLEYSATDLGTAAGAIAAEADAVAREADPDQRLVGARLGPYKIESIIGHGGMGAVYHAVRDDGEFRQQVAVKLVRTAAQSPDTLLRFKQERQILARLSHPNIARLLDGGSTPDAVPYLVMEFIEGEPITHWCQRQSLPLAQCLRLFLNVCEGVEFAHRNLIVHRDLKPANILVTAEGTPKLLDFGIAKMLAHDVASVVTTTLSAAAMTPEYAAPEQVRSDPVSKAVDVYALGLVLYEMLTGRKAQAMPDYSPATIARVICHAEPLAPAVSNPELAGDLDNIIRMAIRKEPERRYASVADLANDIRRHLDQRPVTARPDTAAYRAAKFLRRNRAPVTGGVITALLFLGAALAYWLAKPSRAPRVLQVTQLTQTGHAGIHGGLAADAHYVYFIERSPGQTGLTRVPTEGGSPQPLLSLLQDATILDISPDRTRLLVSSGTGVDNPVWELSTAGGGLRGLSGVMAHTAAWSPDGKSLVFARGPALFTVKRDGSELRKILDTPGWPQMLRWATTPSPAILRFTLRSPDGHGAALYEVRSDGTRPHPLQFNGNSGTGEKSANDDGDWIPGSRYYLFRSFSKAGYGIWVMKEGRDPVLIHSTTSPIDSLTPSPDGKRAFFISSQERRQFVRYDSKRREFVPYLPGTPGRWIGFSHDGSQIAYTTTAPETIWRCRRDGSEAVQLTRPPLKAYFPSWSPDGSWILFTGFMVGQKYGIYAVPAVGGVPQRLTPAGSADSNPMWSPDGRTLLFYHSPRAESPKEKGLYLMDWKTRQITVLPELRAWHLGAWSPDGQRIAVADSNQIQIFELRTRRLTALAKAKAMGLIFWPGDGRYVYYQDPLESGAPIFRAALQGGKVERMMSSNQIPQSDLSACVLVGLAPDDAPIASLVRTNSDIYAIDLDLP